MPSQVVQVQGTSVSVSVAPTENLNPSSLPTMAVLDCTAREIQYQSGTAAEIDVTTFCSTAKEFRLGLDDPGQFTFSGHWVQTDAAHKVIKASALDKQVRLFIVTFSDGSEFRATGFVSQRSFGAAVDGVVTGSFTVRLTGSVLEIDGDGGEVDPENDTRPRFFVATPTAHTSGTQAFLDDAVVLTGGTVGGRAGSFLLRTQAVGESEADAANNYGWVAVLASATTGGLVFVDASNVPGDWNGAGLSGPNTGSSPSPAVSTVTFTDANGHVWRLFRQDYPNANPTPSTWTIS